MTTVRIKHIRQAGFCASGTRAWFEHHKLNYSDFLKNGMDAEAVLKLGDHFGNAAVEKAKAEEEQQPKEAGNG